MRASQALLAAALCAGAAHAARGEEAAERVVLRWQSVPGAAGYDLQVALDAGFGSRELDLRVELAGYRMAASGVRRYWRVRAVDADGRAGPWSASKTIEPLQRAPARADGPRTAPEPALLQVPPLPPAAVEEAAPQAAEAKPPAAVVVLPASEAVGFPSSGTKDSRGSSCRGCSAMAGPARWWAGAPTCSASPRPPWRSRGAGRCPGSALRTPPRSAQAGGGSGPGCPWPGDGSSPSTQPRT